MTVEEWVRVLSIAKDYGINHYRFHTWCPPEAAFTAADIVGIYMHPELPNWTAIGEKANAGDGDVELRDDGSPGSRHTQFLLAEGKRILDAYGNHASFVMFALGNELHGSRPVMEVLIREFRQHDPRPLYAEGSNNFFTAPSLAPADDYWTTTMTGGHYYAGVYYPDTRERLVRASYPVHTVGHLNNRSPSTDFDYSAAIRDIPVPVIGHEIGQYQVYPDFREIPRYTGVLQARHFEMFQSQLKRAGMLDQAEEFLRASGALAVICYREDIEAALRTPGFGGFQLLDLQDYPGQGLPTVGVLDAFMQSKGLIEPELWREFCDATVPLLRLPRRTWTASETMRATVQVANYGPDVIRPARINWAVEKSDGTALSSGAIEAREVPQGALTSIGQLEIPLIQLTAPSRVTVRLWLDGTSARNRYSVWVYPDSVQTAPPPGVLVARAYNETVRKTLAAGGRVLLLASSDTLARSIPGAFQTDFWSYPMFKKYHPPGTLGIICDPKHPALSLFPTEFHADWQWWRILRHGRAMILDGTPASFRPIVQVIDNVERNHKLALLFEARVGAGRLLACSGALLTQSDAPEARQLLHSLLAYAASDAFDPPEELDEPSLKQALATP